MAVPTNAVCKSALTAKTIHIDKDVMEQGSKGCLTKCIGSSRSKHFAKDNQRHGAYAKLGREAINADGAKRAIYERDFSRLPLTLVEERQTGTGKRARPANPKSTPGAWSFSVAANYKVGYRPYNHDYHHMLPWDAFYKAMATAGGGVEYLTAIQASTYNVNNGKNLIILPKTSVHARNLELPMHPNDHPDYSRAVAAAVNGVVQKLASSPSHPTAAALRPVKDYFLRWQDKEFQALVDWGRAGNAGRHVNLAPISDMMDDDDGSAERPVKRVRR